MGSCVWQVNVVKKKGKRKIFNQGVYWRGPWMFLRQNTNNTKELMGSFISPLLREQCPFHPDIEWDSLRTNKIAWDGTTSLFGFSTQKKIKNKKNYMSFWILVDVGQKNRGRIANHWFRISFILFRSSFNSSWVRNCVLWLSLDGSKGEDFILACWSCKDLFNILTHANHSGIAFLVAISDLTS